MDTHLQAQIHTQYTVIGAGSNVHEEQASTAMLRETNEDIQRLRHELMEAHVHIQELRQILDAIVNSKAWRATEVPRHLFDSLKGLFRPVLQKAVGHDRGRQMEYAAQEVLSQVDDEANPLLISDTPATRIDCLGRFQSTADTIAGCAPRAQCVLFIDALVPDATRDSGSCRLLALMSAVASIGYKVEFAADSEVAESSCVMNLEELGIEVILGRDAASNRIEARADSYNLFFVSRPDQAAFYLPLIRYYSPQAIAIYDTVDLYFLRYSRASLLPDISNDDRQGYHELSHHYSLLEHYLATAADRIIVVSDDERVVVEGFSGSSPVLVLPNIHKTKELDSSADFTSRSNILFAGSFKHMPNVDAVFYFVNHVMPLLTNRISDLVFIVVGSGMPDSIRDLASANVLPLGFVDDLTDLYRSIRVVVAPLRYGAGLKGKVGESMSFGVPVVGTPLAFEGFGIQAGKHALVADNPHELAEAVANVYTNQSLWEQISIEAHSFIDERFSERAVLSRIKDVFSIPANP